MAGNLRVLLGGGRLGMLNMLFGLPGSLLGLGCLQFRSFWRSGSRQGLLDQARNLRPSQHIRLCCQETSDTVRCAMSKCILGADALASYDAFGQGESSLDKHV